jgi:hypothetical protein
MNIYEFVEVLRRQKWLLAIGGGMLILLVTGVWLSIAPKYTATARLVVAEAGITDLTDAGLATSDFVRIAEIYGDLLSSTEAEEEIASTEGIDIEDLRVTTSDRTSLLELAVDSPTSKDATAGALGGFSWLQERLRQSPEVVITPVDNSDIPPVVVDPAGLLDVDVELEVESLYSDVDPGLWFEVDTFEGESFATPLALLESGMSFSSTIDTNGSLAVRIGPETGRSFDELQLTIPDLPEDPPPGIRLRLRMGRGAVLFTDDIPRLNLSAFSLSWENPTTASGQEARVAVLLLNPDLTAVPVGQRRGPVISAAILMLGFACLLILATARDGWQRRREERNFARLGAAQGVVAAPDTRSR